VIAGVVTSLLVLAAPPEAVPTDSPRPAAEATEPVPEASPPAPSAPPPSPSAPGKTGKPGPVVEGPPVPQRDDYLDGPIPTDSPPGSQRGKQREGEVWRPITPPTYEKQPVPSDAAVAGQGNHELTDTLAKKKGPKRYDSPQRFALEVKFGPYLPEIDRKYGGDGLGPYANVYGETDEDGRATGQPKKGFYGAIAIEYQIVNLAGPLGIGFQWSMFRDKAQALLADPPAEGSVRSEADTTRFSTMPLALQAVYRFELLADRWRIPLVPYAKFGLNYSFWWSKNGSGKISTIKDDEGNVIDKARGGAWGFQGNFGGMLRLDWLERGEARNLDRITGINHTYVFGEFQFSRVNNFGRKNSINLGDATWLVGLAIEF
jgi:hypothetical protein